GVMVTYVVTVRDLPFSLVSFSLIVYVPAFVYACAALKPVSVLYLPAESPKSHSTLAPSHSPLLSVDLSAFTWTACPAGTEASIKSMTAVGASASLVFVSVPPPVLLLVPPPELLSEVPPELLFDPPELLLFDVDPLPVLLDVSTFPSTS